MQASPAGCTSGRKRALVCGVEPIADLAIGESRPGVPMTSDTLMIWLSATKPITAVCIAQLWEQGKLSLDDRVTEIIPEFTGDGKNAITIRHLLTHTAGIRAAANNFTRDSFEITLEKIYHAKVEPGWVPGQKAGITWLPLGSYWESSCGELMAGHSSNMCGMKSICRWE